MDLDDKQQFVQIKSAPVKQENQNIEDDIDDLINEIAEENTPQEEPEVDLDNDRIFNTFKEKQEIETPEQTIDSDDIEEIIEEPPKVVHNTEIAKKLVKRVAIKPAKKSRRRRKPLSDAHKEKLRLGRLKSLETRRKKAAAKKKTIKKPKKKPVLQDKINKVVDNKNNMNNMNFDNISNFFKMMEQYESYKNKNVKKNVINSQKKMTKNDTFKNVTYNNYRKNTPYKPRTQNTFDDGLDFLYSY